MTQAAADQDGDPLSPHHLLFASSRMHHGRARTWSSPSRHPLFVYLGTADRACCALWEALHAGKKIYHWDDCGTNVAGNVYAPSFSRATSKLSHMKCRSPWMSQERDECGAMPYVTCRFALCLFQLSLMMIPFPPITRFSHLPP